MSFKKQGPPVKAYEAGGESRTRRWLRGHGVAVAAGCLGGLVPLVVNYVFVESNTLGAATVGNVVGWVLRSLGLMFLGGVYVLLEGELDMKKALRLGILAPAFFTQVINARIIEKKTAPPTAQVETGFVLELGTPAYAQPVTTPVKPVPKPPAQPPPPPQPKEKKSFFQEVLDGVKGDF